jgi:hypothetical protein
MPGLGCDQGRAAVYRVVGHSAKVHGNRATAGTTSAGRPAH